MNKLLLHIEGMIVFVLCLYFIDSMVGYGLKYPTDFKHNHLNQM